MSEEYKRLILRGKVMAGVPKTNEELMEIIGGCIPEWREKEFNDLKIVTHLTIDEKQPEVHHYSFEIYEESLPIIEDVLFVIWKTGMDDFVYSVLGLTLLGVSNQPGVRQYRFDDGMCSLLPVALVQQTEIE